jgi:hypothetical protein
MNTKEIKISMSKEAWKRLAYQLECDANKYSSPGEEDYASFLRNASTAIRCKVDATPSASKAQIEEAKKAGYSVRVMGGNCIYTPTAKRQLDKKVAQEAR